MVEQDQPLTRWFISIKLTPWQWGGTPYNHFPTTHYCNRINFLAKGVASHSAVPLLQTILASTTIWGPAALADGAYSSSSNSLDTISSASNSIEQDSSKEDRQSQRVEAGEGKCVTNVVQDRADRQHVSRVSAHISGWIFTVPQGTWPWTKMWEKMSTSKNNSKNSLKLPQKRNVKNFKKKLKN